MGANSARMRILVFTKGQIKSARGAKRRARAVFSFHEGTNVRVCIGRFLDNCQFVDFLVFTKGQISLNVNYTVINIVYQLLISTSCK